MKRMINFRLESDLADRLDNYAREHGWVAAQHGLRGGDHRGKDTGKSSLLVHLVEALVEGRLIEIERAGNSAFPLDSKEAGISPAYPATITLD